MADVVVPPLGETVHEVRIMRWIASVGDAVAAGDPLVEVETDKVETELPAPFGGTVTALPVAEGDTVEIGTVIAVFGGDVSSPASMTESAEPVPVPAVESAAAPAEPLSLSGVRIAPRIHPGIRSPLARRLIVEHDVDLEAIVPTGADQRITGADIRAHIAARRTTHVSSPVEIPQPVAGNSADHVAFNVIRRRTAERMAEAHAAIPAVTTAMRVNFDRVGSARASYRARHGESLTFMPFVARAIVESLREYPRLNATLVGDGIDVHASIHLGIAVALGEQGEAGLLVPVVRNAQDLRLEALGRRIATIADAARHRRLGADDLTGSTITITNAGSTGTLVSTPIINSPEVGIVSLEGIAKEPAVITTEDGGDAIRAQLTGYLSLTYDHRAVDGAYAAGFLNRVRGVLQTADWHRELGLGEYR